MYGVEPRPPGWDLSTGDDAEKVDRLLEAYAISCDPKLLVPLAHTLERLGRLDAALATTERYLAHDPDVAETDERMRALKRDLERRRAGGE